ncbi:DMT family transporter [Herbiconiux sp. L3-i23]|uniref:EamA family transporter n=1 Tax=Herbiconiux sp. L3-i23 TaxID=2905871 RepID=UPI00205BD9B0|nr:DMT family transporter [Herbiconiux sp. L3-i23]BDI23238.1 permease [Herbiconiux sp. L3-i23]
MGYVWAVLSAILFGINGSVAKVAIEAGITAAQLTFFRSIGAAVLCAVALLIVDRRGFRPDRRSLLGFAVLGLIGVAGVQWLYAMAISRLPVGIALMIEYLGVPLVALAALVLFRERIRPRLWAGIALMLAGLAVVAQVWDSRLDALGLIFAVLAAVALAVYFIVGERGVRSSSPLAVGFWSMLTAAVFWSLFSGWWEIDPAVFGRSVALEGVPGVEPPVWVALIWIVALGSFAPFVLSFLALRTLGATRGGVLASAEVVFAFAAAWLLLGESLDLLQLLGGAAVIAGIVLAQTARPGTAVDADLALPPPTDPPRRERVGGWS